MDLRSHFNVSVRIGQPTSGISSTVVRGPVSHVGKARMTAVRDTEWRSTYVVLADSPRKIGCTEVALRTDKTHSRTFWRQKLLTRWGDWLNSRGKGGDGKEWLLTSQAGDWMNGHPTHWNSGESMSSALTTSLTSLASVRQKVMLTG